jgi:type IV pilus assembly protein PilX
MLNRPRAVVPRVPRPRTQQGLVLFVALIVLVALALATAAMMRSVGSGQVIAGNLAFQQSAVGSSDRGTEAAVAWLENNKGLSSSSSASACSVGSSVLACDQSAQGYLATRSDPASSVALDAWWTTLAAAVTPVSLASDAAGNSVSYLIQRMCNATGDASGGNCAITPSSTECGQSHNVNSGSTGCDSQVYYRITVKTTGPRNTVSYTQSMVAM